MTDTRDRTQEAPPDSERARSGVVARALPYLVAVLAAFAVSAVFIALMGYDPGGAFATILLTSFRTPNGFVQTLHKFIPLVLQALAFTVPLIAGKFNIGGEGQLLMGAIGATAAGILLAGLPAVVLLPLVLAAGVLVGAAWAMIAAWLLDRFGINEILTTVLLNFVSFGFVAYVANEIWSDPAAGHPTTIPIDPAGWLPRLIPSPPLHAGLLVALVAAVGAWLYATRTSGGYELTATGANARAAGVHGVPVRRIAFWSLVAGGALAGLSGSIEVAGIHHKLIEGMQSNFLLLGIIIGLIARGNLAVVPFVAFFIAVLEVGASAMQRTVGVPVEMVLIVEALMLLFVLLSDVVSGRLKGWRWSSS